MALAAEAQPRRRASARGRVSSSFRSRELAPFTVEHFCAWAHGLVLDSGEPWDVEPFQQAFLEDVFAGVPECWLVVPEGNGKTTLIAGLVLYVCEFSPKVAAIPIAASARDQAEVLYRQAARIVIDNPRMHKMVHNDLARRQGKVKQIAPRFRTYDGYRKIQHVSGSEIRVHAADAGTGDGVLFTLAILDELHRHRDLSLYRTWTGKRLKRGGQVIAISTAGEPGSDFEATRERIRQEAPDIRRTGRCYVRAASESVVLHDYAVPEDGDIEDVELVREANPFSLITLEALAAKRRSETMSVPHWKRFTCNQAARAEGAAITETEWDRACVAEGIPEGARIWLGLDVAWKWDTTSLVPFWPRELRSDERAHGDGEWPAASFRLLGPATVLTPPRDGNPLDPDDIEAALLRIDERNPIDTVVMDTTRAEQLGVWIERTIRAEVVDRQQSVAEMAKDTEAFLDALRAGRLHHTGDASLKRHALNAILHQLPNEKLKFERPKPSRAGGAALQDRRVIDALVAAAMVHRAWIENPPAPVLDVFWI